MSIWRGRRRFSLNFLLDSKTAIQFFKTASFNRLRDL
jgi:hypothetical protein